MPPTSEPWAASFRTPSPSTDPEDTLPSQSGARGGNDLIRDLDLSLRDDRAVYRVTPFTLAKKRLRNERSGVRKIGNVLSAEDRKRGALFPSYAKVITKPSAPSKWKGKSKAKADAIPPAPLPSPPPRPPLSQPLAPPFRPPSSTNTGRGPRPAVLAPLPPPPGEEEKPRRNKSGWVDQNGEPVADAPAPRRPSVLQTLAEQEVEEEKKKLRRERAKATRRRNAEMKKREVKGGKDAGSGERELEERKGEGSGNVKGTGKDTRKEAKKEVKRKNGEKVQFGVFPKGAGPTEDYPILLAIDKQKKLSFKAPFQPPKPKLRSGEIALSPRRKLSPIEDIDDLICGPAYLRQPQPRHPPQQEGTANDPFVLDTPPAHEFVGGSPTRTTPTLVNASSCRGKSLSEFGGAPHAKSSGADSYRTYVNPRGSEDDDRQRQRHMTLPTYDVLSNEDGYGDINELNQEQDHPSTITQLPSSVARETTVSMATSNAIPFSSPLVGRGRGGRETECQTVQPLVRRADGRYGEEGYRSMDVERLEAAAERYEIPLQRNPTPINMYRASARSLSSKPKLNSYSDNPLNASPLAEWSTLPTKRKPAGSSNAAFGAPNSTTFKLPSSLLPSSLNRPKTHIQPRTCMPASPSPPPTSPPRKYSKITLFTPSSLAEDAKRPPKPVYTVKTIKGSRYASSADLAAAYRPSAGITGRLTLPPSATAPRSGGYARWAYSQPPLQRAERDELPYSGVYGGQGPEEAGPSSVSYVEQEQGEEEEGEENWTSAWKVRGRREGKISRGRDEADMEASGQYEFQPYGRY